MFSTSWPLISGSWCQLGGKVQQQVRESSLTPPPFIAGRPSANPTEPIMAFTLASSFSKLSIGARVGKAGEQLASDCRHLASRQRPGFGLNRRIILT